MPTDWKTAPIQQVVDVADWQSLRERLVGTWTTKPHWALRQIQNWLGDPSKANDRHLRIILNYLTGSGFRTGKIDFPALRDYTKLIQDEWEKRKSTA